MSKTTYMVEWLAEKQIKHPDKYRALFLRHLAYCNRVLDIPNKRT